MVLGNEIPRPLSNSTSIQSLLKTSLRGRATKSVLQYSILNLTISLLSISTILSPRSLRLIRGQSGILYNTSQEFRGNSIKPSRTETRRVVTSYITTLTKIAISYIIVTIRKCPISITKRPRVIIESITISANTLDTRPIIVTNIYSRITLKL